MDKAIAMFSDMHKNHMIKDAVVCNTILDGCSRHGRFDLAQHMLQRMETLNITPSVFTLGILIKMYGKRRQLGRAFEEMHLMEKRHGIKANAQVQACLICACVSNGALDRAFTVLEEAKKSPGGVDAKVYTALIFGCLRHKQIARAVTLVEEAYGLTDARCLVPGQVMETEALEKVLQAISSRRGLAQEIGLPLLQRIKDAQIPLSGRTLSLMLGGSDGSKGKKLKP